jgi:hypothetical protein
VAAKVFFYLAAYHWHDVLEDITKKGVKWLASDPKRYLTESLVSAVIRPLPPADLKGVEPCGTTLFLRGTRQQFLDRCKQDDDHPLLSDPQNLVAALDTLITCGFITESTDPERPGLYLETEGYDLDRLKRWCRETNESMAPWLDEVQARHAEGQCGCEKSSAAPVPQ